MAQHDGQTSGVILASVPAKEGRPKIVYRQAGDRFMLVEFGDMEFDLIYVNGDNHLENLRRPDETWKVRLIEEDFKRLMFDVEDV